MSGSQYLALDMVFLVAGNKTAQEIVNMVSGGGKKLIMQEDDDPKSPANIGRDEDGNWLIVLPKSGGTNPKDYLSNSGLFTILHEMGHLVDVWLTGEAQRQVIKGWSDNFSRVEWTMSVDGWIFENDAWKWNCNTSHAPLSKCDGAEAPTRNETFKHWNPGEDFASSFASVIINKIKNRKPISMLGSDLSGLVTGHSRVVQVDTKRESTVMTVLQKHEDFMPSSRRWGLR